MSQASENKKPKVHSNSYFKAPPNGKGENRDPPKLENSNLKRKKPNSKIIKSKIKCCKERKHFAKKRAFINTGYI